VQRLEYVRRVYRQLQFSSVRQFSRTASLSSGSANDIEDSHSPELSRFPRMRCRIWRVRMAPTLHQIVVPADTRRRLQALPMYWTPRLPSDVIHRVDQGRLPRLESGYNFLRQSLPLPPRGSLLYPPVKHS